MLKRPKEKKCRAPGCSNKFIPVTPFKKACCFECEVALGLIAAEKSKESREKKDREETRKKIQALKTRRDWIKDVQRVFNLYIRTRDQIAGYPCISSGRPLDWSGNAVDAGHYRSVGSAPHLRFDERNCHAQSKHDNQWKSGNAVDYRLGLIERIGLKAVEELEADQTEKHYTIDELKRLKAHYVKKRKGLVRDRESIAHEL